MWYETSSKNSFAESEAQDGETVSSWYDINPQAVFKLNANESDADSRPQYIENVFNGAPGLLFDGVDDSFNLDTQITFPSTSFTAIAVFKNNEADKRHFILASTITTDGSDQIIRYRGDIASYTTYNGTAHNGTIELSTEPRIVSLIQNGTSAQFFDNGNALTAGAVDDETYRFGQIGALGNNQEPFDGYMAEIIVFTRALKNRERSAIESYLSQKYAITISS